MAGRGKRRVRAAAAALALAAPAARAAQTLDFLNIPVGGRPAALGGAYTALAADAYAPVWNPAGLGRLPGPQAALMHLDYAGAVGYEFAGGAAPLGARGGVGLSAQYLHPKPFTARDEQGNETGSVSSSFAAYTLAYGVPLGPRLSVGAAAKLLDARIGEASARSAAGDVGGLLRVSPRLSVGASASNLGGKVRFLEGSESLPQTYRLGFLLSPLAGWDVAAETSYDAADLASGRLGAEWRPVGALALRAGYRSTGRGAGAGGLSGLMTGVGLRALGQQFDYAWEPMGQLGQAQYFSLLIGFGPAGAR